MYKLFIYSILQYHLYLAPLHGIVAAQPLTARATPLDSCTTLHPRSASFVIGSIYHTVDHTSGNDKANDENRHSSSRTNPNNKSNYSRNYHTAHHAWHRPHQKPSWTRDPKNPAFAVSDAEARLGDQVLDLHTPHVAAMHALRER